MSGGSWADPFVFDMSAASGSQEFDTGGSAPPWTYHDSANTSTTYFPATAALDGAVDTCWETNGDVGPTPTWYAIKPTGGGSVEVSTYHLRPRSGWAGRAPEDWTFQGSNDGSSWTTLDTQTGVTDWDGSGAVKNFTLGTPATYNYFRINVTAIVSDGIVNLGEFYLNATPNPSAGTTYFYLKLTDTPDNRVYLPDITSGTGTFHADWGGWYAYTTVFPPEVDTVGSYNPFSPGTSTFYSAGVDLIVKIRLDAPGTFTWAWTSTDWDPRPYTWADAEPLTPVSGGSVDYDDIHGDNYSHGRRRFYYIEPTSTDALTFTIDEPDGYFEVYRETGLDTYDDYMEDGYTDGTGAVDPDGGDCVIVPTVGERYVIVVYPNGDPDFTTEYTLTWSADALDPPPYVVDNDDVDNAQTVVLGPTLTGTFDYDNTGATIDPGLYGKRSIWYAFTLATPKVVRFSAQAGNADPGCAPTLDLYKADHSFAPWNTVAGALVSTLDAGSYLLQVYFDDAIPTSPWDPDGVVTWAAYDRPANFDPSTPGAAGQVTAITTPVAGYSHMQYFTITMPVTGGLSIVIEREEAGFASATVSFGVESASLPVRIAGATTPGAWIHHGDAGQVFTVAVIGTLATLRWGVDVVPEGAFGPWHSTDFYKNDATWDGSAWVHYEPTEVRWRGWQGVYDVLPGATNDGLTADDYVATGGLQEYHTPAYVDSTAQTALLADAVNGVSELGDSPRINITYDRYPNQFFSGYTVVGIGPQPGHPETELYDYTGNNATFRHRVQRRHLVISAPTSEVSTLRQRPLAQTNAHPIYAAAKRRYAVRHGLWAPSETLVENEIGDDIPDGYSTFTDGWVAGHLQEYAIQWSADNPTNAPRFDLVHHCGWSFSREVHGGGGDPPRFTPTEPVTVELHIVDAEATDWPLPEDVAAGDLIDTFTTGTAGSGSSPQVFKTAEVSDIFGGVWPEAWTRDSAYAIWSTHSSSRGASIAHAGYHAELAAIQDEDVTTTNVGSWPFWGQEFSFDLRTEIQRRYPMAYRLARYVENLAPLAIETTPPPRPGYYIHPTPNLDGEGHGVEVSFASAT